MSRGFIKKSIVIAAAALAACSLAGTASYAEETSSLSHLSVAGTTPLTGRFFSDQWGNGAADLDVRSLIHGYNLIRWNAEEGMFETDASVVSGNAVSKNSQGDQSFHISIYQDLEFSDGSRITAHNYVFSILLGMAPQMKELGADTSGHACIKGAAEYADGKTDVLTGVRIKSDYEFTITIDHEQLPFFYELGLLDVVPYPIGEIAPGYQVADNGEGVSFINETTGQVEAPPASLLRETILDETAGYAAHPAVVSGPYLLDSFDGETAEFSINPLYKGNWEGIKPAIQTITFGSVTNADMIGLLSDGQIDLVNRVSDHEALQAGIAATAAGEDITMASYPRSGLSFISFCTGHSEALSSEAVRQAFAWCLDREGLTQAYEDRYGVPVSGWYGIGQWVYSKEKDFTDQLPAYEGEEAESVAEAEALLEADGWTLNKDGEAYVSGQDDVRCKKMEDGSLLPLEFTIACPESTRAQALLDTYLKEKLAKAGIALTTEAVDGASLLNMYSDPDKISYDLLYLATNFSVVFDPCDLFVKNEEGIHEWGSTGIADEELYDLAQAMRRCEPGDMDTYRSRWEDFQTRFCKILPALPVYSNVYFDFYTASLKNYDPALTTSWAQSVSQAYLNDAPAPADAP